MNCKPNTLVYIAKVIPWRDNNSGATGTLDIRGVVFKVLNLYPNTTQWRIETPVRVDKKCSGSDGRLHEFRGTLWAMDDEYLRPFGDPDFNETIETTKELTI